MRGFQVPPECQSQRGRYIVQIVLAIVVSNPCLNILLTVDSGFLRIRNDVHQRNAVQADHLLEVNVPVAVPPHVLDRDSEVRSVGVGLQDVAPRRTGRFLDGYVHEDRLRARLQNSICLPTNEHLRV